MANELLASLDDINTHLPADKARMLASDDDLLQVDVARYIKALLSGTFSKAVLASWADPATTPELIRAVAGRLIAAKYYATLYSEDDTDVPEYSQNLYDEATNTITAIRSGTITVLDASLDPVVTEDSDGIMTNLGDTTPKFTMNQVFG